MSSLAERRHDRGIEAGERSPERLALAQDRDPRQAGLETLEAELLEQRTSSTTRRPHSSSWYGGVQRVAGGRPRAAGRSSIAGSVGGSVGSVIVPQRSRSA